MSDPEALLTHYYLHTFVPSLPLALQPLALDRRIWLHAAESSPIESAIEFDLGRYSLLPYQLQTIFGLDDSQVAQLGQAWLLLFGHYVIRDHWIDGQLPAEPLLPIFMEMLQTHGQNLLHDIVGESAAFWHDYDRLMADCRLALIYEWQAVNAHQTPYTYERMRVVYQHKTAIYRLLIAAMAQVAQRPDLVAPLCEIIDSHGLAIQLIDDAGDWASDFAAAQYKLPVVMALDAAGLDFAAASTLSVAQLGSLLAHHHILPQIADRAIAALQHAHDITCALPVTHDTWLQTLDAELANARHARRSWAAWSRITQFSVNLGDG